MELREVLTRAAEFWLEQNQKHPGKKFTLSDREIESFLKAADSREDEIWHQIEVFLDSLTGLYPVRAVRMKRDLKWVRKMAKKRGVVLGRK